MKNIYIVLMVLLITTSCSSTYFFTTLNTASPNTQKVDNGDLVFENDSLWIAYSFYGENAPIDITIYNKLNIPLYVDWSRSALIIDDQAISYAGDVASSFYEIRDYAPYESEVRGQVVKTKKTSFIPPYTKVSNQSLSLNLGIKSLEKQSFKTAQMGNKDNNRKYIKRADFSIDDSPLKFTSYITIYAQPENPISYEQDFYITTLIKTREISPSKLPKSMKDRGDTFYTIKPANNTGWEILLGTVIIAGGMYLDATTNTYHTNDDCCY